MISRYDIDYVKVGQKAVAVVGDTRYEGVVDSIAEVAALDSSNKPKVKVTIKFEDKKASPIIGLEADITLYMEEVSDAICVSDKAVYTDDDGDYVYVVRDKKVTRVNITIGNKGGGVVEVIDGIKVGDEVIVSPVSKDLIGETVITK